MHFERYTVESSEKQKACKLLAETSTGRQYTVKSNENRKLVNYWQRPLMVGNILWSQMRNRKCINC